MLLEGFLRPLFVDNVEAVQWLGQCLVSLFATLVMFRSNVDCLGEEGKWLLSSLASRSRGVVVSAFIVFGPLSDSP